MKRRDFVRLGSLAAGQAVLDGCVATLGEACAKTGWQVQAYVLIPNHFHLVVDDTPAQSGRGHEMVAGHLHQPVQLRQKSRAGPRHKLFGHLFSGRYKSLIVEGSGSGYL